jgi:muconolactone D-isomerase
MEFITSLFTVVPEGTPAEVEADLRARERVRAGELAEQGNLIRLWRAPLPSGPQRTLALWRAADEEHLRQLVSSLPLHVWMTVEVTELTVHPNDPASQDQLAEEVGR